MSLGVVAGFSGEAGEMHGEEGGVGSDDGEPEVEAAEGFGHEAAGCLGGMSGEPVVGGGEEAEDGGHGHDEVEVGDDEEGVVEVLVEDGLGEDGAGEASGDEEGDEAEGEEHRRLCRRGGSARWWLASLGLWRRRGGRWPWWRWRRRSWRRG